VAYEDDPYGAFLAEVEGEEGGGLLGGLFHAIGAPKRGVDWFARTVARQKGLPVPESVRIEDLLVSGLGYDQGDEAALTPAEQHLQAAAKGVTRLAGSLALDPASYVLGGALTRLGASAGRGAQLAARAAGLGFGGQMAIGATEAGREIAQEVGEEGWTPRATEKAVETALLGAGALGAGLHALTPEAAIVGRRIKTEAPSELRARAEVYKKRGRADLLKLVEDELWARQPAPIEERFRWVRKGQRDILLPGPDVEPAPIEERFRRVREGQRDILLPEPVEPPPPPVKAPRARRAKPVKEAPPAEPPAPPTVEEVAPPPPTGLEAQLRQALAAEKTRRPRSQRDIDDIVKAVVENRVTPEKALEIFRGGDQIRRALGLAKKPGAKDPPAPTAPGDLEAALQASLEKPTPSAVPSIGVSPLSKALEDFQLSAEYLDLSPEQQSQLALLETDARTVGIKGLFTDFVNEAAEAIAPAVGTRPYRTVVYPTTQVPAIEAWNISGGHRGIQINIPQIVQSVKERLELEGRPASDAPLIAAAELRRLAREELVHSEPVAARHERDVVFDPASGQWTEATTAHGRIEGGQIPLRRGPLGPESGESYYSLLASEFHRELAKRPTPFSDSLMTKAARPYLEKVWQDMQSVAREMEQIVPEQARAVKVRAAGAPKFYEKMAEKRAQAEADFERFLLRQRPRYARPEGPVGSVVPTVEEPAPVEPAGAAPLRRGLPTPEAARRGTEVAATRVVQMAQAGFDSAKARMAEVLDEPEVADLTIVPGKTYGLYKGKRALGIGEKRTGEIEFDPVRSAAAFDSPEAYARWVSDTIFAHEPAHARGLHEIPTGRGELRVGETEVVLPEAAAWHTTEGGRLREAVSPEEARFGVGREILRQDPEVSAIRRQFEENLVQQLRADGGRMWYQLKRLPTVGPPLDIPLRAAPEVPIDPTGAVPPIPRETPTPSREAVRARLARVKHIPEKRLEEAVTVAMERPEALPDLLREYKNPSLWEKALEGWKGFLLSSPGTMFIQIADVFEQGVRIGETGMAVGLDALATKVLGGTRVRHAPEMRAEVRGMLSHFPAAWKEFTAEVKNLAKLGPEKIDIERPVEFQTGAIGGTPGRIIRLPMRWLGAISKLLRRIGTGAELHKRALRQAKKEMPGAAPDALDARVEEIVTQALDMSTPEGWELLRDANKAGKDRTFEAEPGKLLNGLLSLRNDNPWMHGILPFLHVPGNITRLIIERTPAGFVKAALEYKKWKAAEAAGRHTPAELAEMRGRVIDSLARPLAGTAIIALFGAYAKAGGMTGSGPKDKKAKALLRQTGWQPYSFVVRTPDGGRAYVPFSRFQPLGALLGFAADLNEAADTPEWGERFSKVLSSVSNNITDQSYLSGLTDALDLASNPEENIQKYVASQAGTVVPGIIAKAAQAIDPTIRETRAGTPGLLGAPEAALRTIASRLPGVSTLVPERMGPAGEAIERPGTGPLGAAMRFLSPIQASVEEPDAEVMRLIADVGAAPAGGAPKTVTIRGVPVPLEEGEGSEIAEANRQAIDYIKENYLTDPRFMALRPFFKKRYIQRVFERFRDVARRRVMASHPFRERAVQALREAREASL
jgi:hypothetical protein